MKPAGARWYVVHAPELLAPGELLGVDQEAGGGVPAPAPKATINPMYARWLWGEFHARTLSWAGGEDGEWLVAFARRLPCGECRVHWLGMVARTPPDWADYFRWGVARHNEVNARLGKEQITERDAQAIWQGA